MVFAVKPVPETETAVAEVKPLPFTFTDCCEDVLAFTVPKLTVEPFVGEVKLPPVTVVEPETVAFNVTFTVLLPFVRVRVPVYVPPFAPLKFTMTVAPDVELTLDALRVVAFTVNPVPETDTAVASVNPEPFTTTDCCTVLFAEQVPKSTVEPFAGEVNVAEDEDAV